MLNMTVETTRIIHDTNVFSESSLFNKGLKPLASYLASIFLENERLIVPQRLILNNLAQVWDLFISQMTTMTQTKKF